MINIIRKVINYFHFDIKRYPSSDLRRRKKLFKYFGINKILDVGANNGQYALQIFELGFDGKIISFEPIKSVYNELYNKTSTNKNWEAYNFGLGDKNENNTINISENIVSSSLLDIMPNHIEGAPESKVIKTETIEIKTLDSVYNNIVNEEDQVLLKIDVQGFEKKVIKGALKIMPNIKGIQIEMSLEELYKGEMLFEETISLLSSLGFELHSLENGLYNNDSGKLLQVDGIFFR